MMKTIQLDLFLHRLTLHVPEDGCECAVYLPMQGDARGICDLLPEGRAALVTIDGFDWNRDLSPWPAQAVFGTEDFGGQADAFLRILVDELMPAAEREMGCTPVRRMIAGYSLSGLFAMYAAYRTDLFSAAASVSGSMWYDGWMDFAQEHMPLSPLERAYFSVGAKEKRTRNPRMARVEDCTREMAALMASRGVESTFELNPGNHFVDVDERMAKGLAALLCCQSR